MVPKLWPLLLGLFFFGACVVGRGYYSARYHVTQARVLSKSDPAQALLHYRRAATWDFPGNHYAKSARHALLGSEAGSVNMIMSQPNAMYFLFAFGGLILIVFANYMIAFVLEGDVNNRAARHKPVPGHSGSGSAVDDGDRPPGITVFDWRLLIIVIVVYALGSLSYIFALARA